MEPFSSHIFLFPFKLDQVEKGKNEIKGFFNEFKEHITNSGWNYITTNEGSDTFYNEKKYFHHFVHPVLFSDKEEHNFIGKDKESPLIEKFVKKEENLTYRIIVNKKEKEELQKPVLGNNKKRDHKAPEFRKITIDLDLKKVTLDLYEQGIGIFAFHLDYSPKFNHNHKEVDWLDYVLLINQYGRRLYPPFLDSHFDDYGDISMDGKSIGKLNKSLEGTKFRELAESISILSSGNLIKGTKEDWTDLRVPQNSLSYIPNHICHFLNLVRDEKEMEYYFINTKENTVVKRTKKEKESKKVEIVLIPVLDDRMFVISWLGAEQLTEDFGNKELKLKEEKKRYRFVLSDLCKRQPGGFEAGGFYRNSNQQRSLAINRAYDGFGYASNDFWYQYIFVDGNDKTCANELLQEQLLTKHTYDRWVGNYSLIGISRYSFVMLTAPLKELKEPWINAAYLPEHLLTLYFRMVSLVLVQRAMVLAFSKEIGEIDIPINKENTESRKIQDEALQVYKNYRDFINKIFHREITAQEQGIELYDMLQEHLRVEKQAKELEKEFEEMHRLITLIGTNQSGKRYRIFTILSALFVIPTLLLNLLKNRNFENLQPISLKEMLEWKFNFGSFYVILFLACLTYLFTNALYEWTNTDEKSYNLFKWKISKKMTWYLLVAIITTLIYLFTFQLVLTK